MRKWFLLVFIIQIGGGCAIQGQSAPPVRATRPDTTIQLGRWKFRKTGTVVGQASFYGQKFHGRKTANGEIYDMHRMTAAHRTLPFGTLLLVTNLKNGKSVIVRINDRGPFIMGRMIDLSFAAAQKLDFINEGVVKVKVEKLQLLGAN